MTPVEPTPEGKVVAVCADPKHRFSKRSRFSITLVAGLGIEGDAHSGPFVKHRYLARRNPRLANMRQVHLIPIELLHDLREVGYDIKPGDLGENVTTVGIDLEALPMDAELRIGGGRLRLTGLRTPCVLIDRFRGGLKAHLVNDVPSKPFRSGVMSIVTGGGLVTPGDEIWCTLPAGPRQPLPAI